LTIEVNRDNYEVEVLQSDLPVVVDFWGPQCKPCLALMGVVEKLDQAYSGKVKVTKLNATENRMLCAKLRVLSLPTFLFYKGGAEVNRLVGDRIGEGDLIKAMDALLS